MPQRSEVDRVVTRSRGRQWWLLALLLALVIIGFVGVRFNTPKPTVLPKITFISATSPGKGMVSQILVKPGEKVRRGELLAVLDYSHLQAQRETAFNNLMEAAEQNPSAGPTISAPLPVPSMMGSLEKRAVPIASTPAPLPPVQKSSPAPQAVAPAEASSATANIQSQIKTLQTTMDSLNKQAATLQQNVSADQDAVNSSQALVASLSAIATKSKADSDKASTLLAEGVLSANDASKAQGYALQSQGKLQEAKVAAAQAVATLGDTQRSLDSTNKSLADDQQQMKQLEAQLTAARKNAKVSQPLPSQMPAQALPAPAPAPKYKLVPVKGPIAPKVPPAPLPVTFTTPAQYQLQVARAEHELNVVDSSFKAVCIYAPADGTVIQVPARSGQMVDTGTVMVQIRRR